MIVRGTTPLHTFALPFPIVDISEVFITYMQNDKIIIEKGKEDIEIDVENNTLFVPLSQDDTLAFLVHKRNYIDNIVLIQIRVLMDDGSSCASDIIRERVCDVLKDGVLSERQEVSANV